MSKTLTEITLPSLKKVASGKVRDIFEIDDKTFLFVASDRISAFDVVMSEGIPEKGVILTKIANFWFNNTKHIIDNHLISSNFNDFPEELSRFKNQLDSRSILVKKCKPLPIEFIVRGYLAGSGWKDYKNTGTIKGNLLPKGLKEFSELPNPILTPSTKAEEGHDINISKDEMAKIIGSKKAKQLETVSLKLYKFGKELLSEKGIILADTKFEFGELEDGNIILIDEVLTPDSSRFWDKDTFVNGSTPHNFDKQTLRNWLEKQNWNKEAPAPILSQDIISNIKIEYKNIYDRIFNS